MISLDTSHWGASFRVIKKFDNDLKGSRSRQSIQKPVNWDAEAVSCGGLTWPGASIFLVGWLPQRAAGLRVRMLVLIDHNSCVF